MSYLITGPVTLGTSTDATLIDGDNITIDPAAGILALAGAIQLSDEFTATGDILYSVDASGNVTRLAIGSVNQVLTVAGGVPSWAGAPVPAQEGFRAQKSATTALVTATATILTGYTAAAGDFYESTAAIFDETNGKFVPQSTGVYTMSATVTWPGSGTRRTTGTRLLEFVKDPGGTPVVLGGTTTDQQSNANKNIDFKQTITTHYEITATDTTDELALRASQDSGANQDIVISHWSLSKITLS